MKELGIKPSEFIKRVLEREVEEKMKKILYEKVERASQIISKAGKESREER